MKRFSVYGLIALITLTASCSTPVPLNRPQPGFETTDFSDLDKEYGKFSTKDLTSSYLLRKITTWLDDDKGPQLLKELRYFQQKDPGLVYSIITLSLLNEIRVVPAVSDFMAANPSFRDFINSLEPVVALSSRLIYKVNESAGPTIYLKNAEPGNTDPAAIIKTAPSGTAFSLNASLLSPDRKKLVITSNGSVNNISLYNLETSTLNDEVFTPGGTVSNVSAQQWSSDGSKLLFTGNENGINNAYTINADGTGLNKVTQNSDSGQSIQFIGWSDNKLIYKVNDLSGPAIYIKNSDPGNIDPPVLVKGVSSSSFFALNFCFLSPDRKKLVITSAGSINNISLYNLETSTLNNEVFAPGGTVSNVIAQQWSSDGSKVLFTGNENGINNAYTINADGTGLNKVTDNTSSSRSIEFIGWSDTKLLYKVNESGVPTIYVKNSDPGNTDPATVIRTAPAGGFFSLTFCFLSPDRKKLVITSGSTGSNISLYNLETGLLNSDVFAPGGTVANVNAQKWSSDGSKLLFTGNENGVNNAYTINADGTGLNKVTDNTVSSKSIEFIAFR
jgi:Tol biopolymer transport system component